MKLNINTITRNAIVAALYFVLTIVTFPISFGKIQFRFAEILIFLCFFKRDYIIGLTLGCLLSNCFSFNPLDIVFGTLATFVSALLVSFTKILLICVIYPVVINGFVVGAELYFLEGTPFWMNVGFVALGEVVVLMIGYIIFMVLRRNEKFMEFIC